EDAIEHRHHGRAAFDLVTEAMAALREEELAALRALDPDADGADDASDGDVIDSDARREAFMRKALRAALREHERVVFVCGAWHAPVLQPDAFPPARADDELLRNLPRAKVAATWVPWTNERLTFARGYGAGA